MGGPEGSSPASEASGSGCFTPPAEAVRRRRSADDPEWGARGEAAPRAKRADQAASLPRRKRSAEGGALTIQNGGPGGKQPRERSERIRLLHSPGGSGPPKAER